MKTGIITTIMIIFIVLIATFFIGLEVRDINNKVDKCKEEGYEGFRNIGNYLESEQRCYKTIQVGGGYEYEYGGRID